ncbi:MAG: hypothetical protein ACR2NP_08915 [Pirellulaceae bacterium]
MKKTMIGLLALAFLATCCVTESFAQQKKEKQEEAKQDEGKQRRGRRGRRGRRSRPDNAPKVGDVAPVFTLNSLDGESETDIASFQGDRPVVLFFGSYT